MHSAKRISRQGFDLTDAFTLTEVIMAMTVFGLVIAGVMAVFIGTIKSMHASSDAIDVNSRSRFVQERLLYDLRAIIEVTAIEDEDKVDTTKIIKGDSDQGYKKFTAKVDEYTKGQNDVTYSINEDGETPAGDKLYTLFRNGTRVLINLQGGCFTFYTRDPKTGVLTVTADKAKATAIRFAFLPQKRGPLIPGKDDPSCSAVVQLRYPSYK